MKLEILPAHGQGRERVYWVTDEAGRMPPETSTSMRKVARARLSNVAAAFALVGAYHITLLDPGQKVALGWQQAGKGAAAAAAANGPRGDCLCLTGRPTARFTKAAAAAAEELQDIKLMVWGSLKNRFRRTREGGRTDPPSGGRAARPPLRPSLYGREEFRGRGG